MNWGKSIVLAFIMFALFIAVLVTVCVKQDIPLVSKEYYKEELAYQEQIARMHNANSLTERPAINVKNNQLVITYSDFSEIERGQVKLFRPSDAKLDQQFVLQKAASDKQAFKLDRTQAGLYKARMTWEQQGKEYFIEKIIVL